MGIIVCGNHTWVAKVNELFLEVWLTDGTTYQTGEQNYHCEAHMRTFLLWLVTDGHTCERLPKTVGLKISDFFPEDEWASCKITASNVHFPPHLFDQVVLAMNLTTRTRFGLTRLRLWGDIAISYLRR